MIHVIILQVLVSILKQNVVLCTQEDLTVLQDRCRDPAPSVRKQTLQLITDLLLVCFSYIKCFEYCELWVLVSINGQLIKDCVERETTNC